MARSIWTGSLAFGLVNVPVRVFSATESKDVHFHQFKAGTDKRVRNMRVVEGTQKEVPYEDVVKGYEVSKGRYVMLTPEELESVEPGRSRTIEIEDFVDLADIDPLYFEKGYYLAPADEGAEKPYALLRQAMLDTGRVAIARFVMRDKQYLVAIRPREDVLVMETLYFADEVRDPLELPGLPVKAHPTARGEIAVKLVDSLARKWDPDRYEDTYRERVLDLIERKAKGETIEVTKSEAPPDNVVDLMEALKASLERGGRGGRSSSRGEEAAESEEAGETRTSARRTAKGSSRRTGSTAGSTAKAGGSKRASSSRSSATKSDTKRTKTKKGRTAAGRTASKRSTGTRKAS